MKTIHFLRDHGIPVFHSGLSALDRYHRVAAAPSTYLTVVANLIDCARILPAITYPGMDDADAGIEEDGTTVYLRCVESLRAVGRNPVDVLNLYHEPFTDRFLDPWEIYPALRNGRLLASGEIPLPEAAVLVSRYPYLLELPTIMPAIEPQPGVQRDVLALILTGAAPWKGLELLMDSGFIERCWPEIFRMKDVSHSKEYHPEGDVWDHTLETFRYRKSSDLALSLALLLHDVGKPVALAQDGRRFDRHAELGETLAAGFLRRLSFPGAMIHETLYLVRHHMLPGLLRELPVHRTKPVMSSEHFPKLLELYRCDLSSTFRGPGGYYEACKIYRAFLKNLRNPYRRADGSKALSLREQALWAGTAGRACD